jgi:hypothetical protein
MKLYISLLTLAAGTALVASTYAINETYAAYNARGEVYSAMVPNGSGAITADDALQSEPAYVESDEPKFVAEDTKGMGDEKIGVEPQSPTSGDDDDDDGDDEMGSCPSCKSAYMK